MKSFGGLRALQDVSFSVARGEIRAIIGPNGAGKSTLFNVMTGLFPPDSGEVVFDGDRISGVPPHRIIRKGIGRSFQITNIFPRMTVFENVQVALFSHHRKSRDAFGFARRYPTVAAEALGDPRAGGAGGEARDCPPRSSPTATRSGSRSPSPSPRGPVS